MIVNDLWLLDQLEQGRLVVRANLRENSRRPNRPIVTAHFVTAYADDDGTVYGAATYRVSSEGELCEMVVVYEHSGDRGNALKWAHWLIHDLALNGRASWQAQKEFAASYSPGGWSPDFLLPPEDVYLASHIARSHGMLVQLAKTAGPEPERTLLHALAHRVDGLAHRAIGAQY